MVPDEFIMSIGDAHLYANQIEPMRQILDRKEYPLPTVTLNPDIKNIFDFTMRDITLVDYQYHPAIKMAVAV